MLKDIDDIGNPCDTKKASIAFRGSLLLRYTTLSSFQATVGNLPDEKAGIRGHAGNVNARHILEVISQKEGCSAHRTDVDLVNAADASCYAEY